MNVPTASGERPSQGASLPPTPTGAVSRSKPGALGRVLTGAACRRAWLVAGVMLGAALLFSTPAVQAAKTHAAAKSSVSKSSASKSSAAKDAVPLIEKNLQVPAEEVNSQNAHVLLGGNFQAPRDVDPTKSDARYWILVRRNAKGVRAMNLPGGGVWGRRPGWRAGANSSAGDAAPPTSNTSASAGSSAAGDAPPIKAYSLPLTFNAVTKAVDGMQSKAVSFEAVVMVLNDLRYQESSHRFEAQIAVGLRNPNEPDSRVTLEDPLSLLVSANAEVVDPQKLSISSLGDPQVVKIAATTPGSPFYVTAGTIGDAGDKIEIPVERPQLTLAAAQKEIEGWGLAKTVIQIAVPGVTEAGTHSITLSTTQGEIIPTPVQLDATGHGSAQLRSDGTGTATITAAGDPFASATTTVDFSTPTNFLISTLVGAFLGWIVKIRAKGFKVSSLVLALASSAILTAAYAIGIHWLKWAPEAGAGEALTFFVAAMGAYLGMQVLTKVTEKAEEEDEGKAKA